MVAGALPYRLDKARRLAGVTKAAFQVRGPRAKEAIDKAESADDVRQAQKQLGARVRHDDGAVHSKSPRRQDHADEVNCGKTSGLRKSGVHRETR